MKLPDDPKQRQQVLIAIGLGSIVVLVVLYMFVVTPFLTARKAKKEEIAKKTSELADARREIDKTSGNRQANRTTLARIDEVSDKHIVHPRTGMNYQLAVREIVEKAAATACVETDPVMNVSTPALIGGGQKDPSRHLKACSATITAKCGYNDVVKLAKAIEKENPYLSVTRVSITGRPFEDVKKHTVSLDVQWPAWIDPAYPDRIQKVIEKIDSPPAPEKGTPAANTKKGGNSK